MTQTACRLAVGLSVLLCAVSVFAEGQELIGTPAPEFVVEQWIQSESLTLAGLQGSVVLVRFWTHTCPFCSASAPVLAQLHERYARDGLVVIGIYHPKPPRQMEIETVAQAARAFGMTFPIGIDERWDTVRRFWLDGAQRSFTSSSFLIDRRGIIRYIHAGGAYTPEEAEALEEAIIRLLARRG